MIKINSGVYAFLDKNGFDKSQVLSILSMYGTYIGMEKPKSKSGKAMFYDLICDKIQDDFELFRTFFNHHKNSLLNGNF